MKLAGACCLITGAGRGFGRALALAFADEGADLILVARNQAELDETAEQVRKRDRRALALAADVADRDRVRKVVARALDNYGRIDVLVNNAAVQGPIGPLVENDADSWTRTVATNLFGAFHCIQAVLPGMIELRAGKIVNVSGGGAAAPRPNFSAYAASKAALVRLTETLAGEVERFDIRVNAIAPGAMKTRMLDEVIAAGTNAGEERKSALERAARDASALDAGTRLAVFLASGDSGRLTGKLIAAEHDPWRDWASDDEELNESPMYTLRRLDPFTIEPLIANRS